MSQRSYWTYLMTNRSGTLYIGVTNNLARRVYEHRHHLVSGFTSRYLVDRLIHAESFSEILDAIAREKQLKNWSRARKLALIKEDNPDWRDSADEWFGSSDIE
jgi:putative endonuclease